MQACVDYGLYLGGTVTNQVLAAALAPSAAGLKLYLNQTYGPLKLDGWEAWKKVLLSVLFSTDVNNMLRFSTSIHGPRMLRLWYTLKD